MNNARKARSLPTLPTMSAKQTAWLKANNIELQVNKERFTWKFIAIRHLESGDAIVGFSSLKGPAIFEVMVNDSEDGWMSTRFEDFDTLRDALKALAAAK